MFSRECGCGLFELTGITMNRSKKHIRESAIVAACFAAIFVVVEIISQLTGARKYGGPAKPKTLLELLHDSPKLLAIGIVTFIVAWWFKAGEKETVTVYVLCRNCLEPFDQDKIPHGVCMKCNGPLEPLEGFYERHPELGAKKKPGKQKWM